MRPLPPVATVVAFVVIAGCSTPEDDTGGGTLPPEDTSGWDDSGTDTFVFDTTFEDTGFDGSPQHLLTMQHEGEWDLSPNGGPWTAMSGELRVVELIDGDDLEPSCEVTFALTGEGSESACDSCTAAFEVLYYVAEGDRDACLDPELPLDGQSVHLGWSEADDTLYLDYQHSGVWVPWYDGDRVDDGIRFEWEATVGVALPDDDQ